MTDNAKELLARAQSFVDRKYVAVSDKRQRDMGLGYVTAERQELAQELALFAANEARLTARQQASARNLANALLDAPAGSATAMSRALLAKYDIFQKVEG